ncbi:longitudinals lacking protein-like [Schistocerca gregaria]|uniref:longitudinals lacking protein-like n=1 Tax=Schistocerca gregaria TaxID=7010 RepID=UPI00211E9897|nr:longitudinals lacking protein-like [Schistocerca gregaria]
MWDVAIQPTSGMVLNTSGGAETALERCYIKSHFQDLQQFLPVFRCGECGKSYRHQKSLSRHKRLECGKQPSFFCPSCSYVTSQRSNLLRHIHSLHANN